jgi:hypothetical protein
MADREFSELELFQGIPEQVNVAVGIIDLMNCDLEDVDQRARRCRKFAPVERPPIAPDCDLSQTAHWDV